MYVPDYHTRQILPQLSGHHSLKTPWALTCEILHLMSVDLLSPSFLLLLSLESLTALSGPFLQYQALHPVADTACNVHEYAVDTKNWNQRGMHSVFRASEYTPHRPFKTLVSDLVKLCTSRLTCISYTTFWSAPQIVHLDTQTSLCTFPRIW